MTSQEYLLLLTGMGLVTFLPRWFPLFFLSKRELPKPIVRWLDLIPAAILSALLVPELLIGGTPKHLVFKPELIVAIPTFWVAFKTKSLGGTVIAGMLLFWLVGKWMG